MNTKQRMDTLVQALVIIINDHPEFEEENTTGNDLINALKFMVEEATDEWLHDTSC